MPREYMIPSERAEAEKAELEMSEKALEEKITKMTPEEIKARNQEIENRFREIDKISNDPKAMEKAYGFNAFEKLENEYNKLERERALLFIEKPIAVSEEKIQEIKQDLPKVIIDWQALDLAEPKEEVSVAEKKPPVTEALPPSNIDQIKKASMADIIFSDLKKAPAQLGADVKAAWQVVRDELKLKKTEKEIWWPEAIEEPVFDLKRPIPLPDPIEPMPIIDLAKKIQEQKVKEMKAKIDALEPGWQEIADELDPTKQKERDEKTRKTKEYKTFKEGFEKLGAAYKDIPIKPRGGDLLINFLDGIYRVGKEDSDLRKAGELLYKDILNGDAKMPVQKWEYRDRLELRAQNLDFMPLLSDLTKEQARIEEKIDKKKKYLKSLEPKIVFLTSTERWSHLAATHNLEVELKIHEEYLEKINKTLELEKTGKRKVKMPEAKEMFKLPPEWLDFPEVEVVEEEAAEVAA